MTSTPPPLPFTELVEYGILLRVPLLVALVAIALPALAFFTPARSLLKGLFDVTPAGALFVTLAAVAVGGTVSNNAQIIYFHVQQRVAGIGPPPPPFAHVWLVVTLATCLPIIVSVVAFSARQRHSLAGLMFFAAVGLASSLYLQSRASGILLHAPWNQLVVSWMAKRHMFLGYVLQPGVVGTDPWPDHLRAVAGFIVAFGIYLIVGAYGRWELGKRRTVPALCSALMVLMLVCWSLAGLAFFFDAWRIPILLVMGLGAIITAQSRQSDHYYHLIERKYPVDSAPTPAETLTGSHSRRIILVAANGGGIQAAAWTAQVLQGLREQFGSAFDQSLRFISSVSGGSLGSACFVYWLADPALAKDAADAAAESSLDEVAWGLGWPDLLRSVLPWVFGWMIGRGRALEKAWCLNSARDISKGSHMDDPLSDWNPRVASGELPAVIMNATVTETGERLLLGTTRVNGKTASGRARVDAAELHQVKGRAMDVGVVTAARLSATFPYVTPASRSDAPGPQPHVVDGGYYDNYGMATLVEWLDEALASTNGVDSVLVLQIHGAPVAAESERRYAKNRGWFYQALAPLTTLAAVRSAGQVAHNDIELEQLQQKWFAAGVPIHSVTFEFPYPNAPLSWHLTKTNRDAISETWRNSPNTEVRAKLAQRKKQVADFLAGSEALNCGCPKCRYQPSC